MHYLKQLDRSALLAWAPEASGGGQPPLLAVGTVAGAVDSNFSTSSLLELVTVDFASPSEAPTVVGSLQAPERFNRLAWSLKVPGDPTFPALGLLAGGLADGSVCLWDPAAILARAEGKQPLLAKMQKHTGAVKGLEFNSFSPNLLASGAADSDLCIWDLAKPTTPSLYPALKGTSGPGGPGGNEITYISWNRKVQHILASCTNNGTTVVWDLKRQKPVISFRDPNSQRRASVLQWNPEVATQLIVASDDDRSPTLQMWDLRNSVSPLKEFVGHGKGVLGMAWSAHDPSLLLSCAKDNRNICWDVQTADIMCELPPSHNWNFDIQWCPTIKGVFSTSSYDGKVGVYNLHACTVAKVTETVNADFTVTQHASETVPLRKAPVWMRRPCGATFGFGGKLVSFVNNKVSAVDATGQAVQRDQAVISIAQVVTEHELVQRSESFEQAIAGGEKPTLQSYCATKAASATESEEKETWSFLALLFETDGRMELLRKLGFEDVVAEIVPPADANGTRQVTASLDGLALGPELALGPDGKAMNGAPSPSGNMGGAHNDFFGDQADDPDFFDKLPDEGIMAASPHATSASAIGGLEGHNSLGGEEVHAYQANMLEGMPDGAHEQEEEIQRAMIAGNYEAAVESCFKAKRMADALLIANVFNGDLFKRTMHRYMKAAPKPYMSIIRATLDGDYETLVRSRPVGSWRETLALLATYTAQEDWTKQCGVLAARLASSGAHHAALLCHICSGDVDAAVAHWARTAGGLASTQVDKLQAVIEKSVIMGMATGSKKTSTALADLITSYASLLAAQGRLTTAMDYLEFVPGEASTTVAVLRDRIYRSGAVAVSPGSYAPPFPFILDDVKPAPIQQAPVAPSYSQQQQATAAGYGAATPNYSQQQQQQQYGQPQQQYSQQQQYGAAPAATLAYGAATTGYGAATPATGYGAPLTVTGYGSSTTANQYSAAPAPTPGYGYSQAPPAPTSTYNGGVTATGAYGPYSQAPAQAQPQTSYTPAYSAAVPATSHFTPTTTTTGSHFAQQQPQQHQQQQPPAPAYQMQAQQQEPQQPVYQGARRSGQAAGGFPQAPAVPPAASSTMAFAAQGGAQPQSQQHAPQAPLTTASNAYFKPTSTPAAAMPTASTPQHLPHHQFGAQPAAGPTPPGMMQPGMAPAVAMKPAAPPPPAGPPANISVVSADVSAVPDQQRPIITSLTNLYNSCMPLITNPAKKREMEDNTKKIGQLFWRLNQRDVSDSVVPKLLQLCQAMDGADWHSANHIQVQMTTTDWDECGFWLSAVKRLIKMRQAV